MRVSVFFSLFTVVLFFVACGSKDRGPSAETIDVAPAEISSDQQEVDNKLESLLSQIVQERNEDGSIKQENLPELMSTVVAYIDKYPSSPKALDFTFKTAEMLKYANDFENSAKFFDLTAKKFHGNERAGHALFLKAVMLEKEMNNKEGAKLAYQEFVNQYPGHPLVGTAEGQLYNLE